MEQIRRPEPSVVCTDCNSLGYLSFLCNTDDNHDTDFCCPLCGKTCLIDIPTSEQALYCTNCKTIAAKSWCLHGHNGCSFDVYYGMWFEIDGMIPIFSTCEEAEKFFIDYKAKKLNVNVELVCGCFGNCCEQKYQCPKAYNTGNPYHDHIVECCNLSHCKNVKPAWYNIAK